jgi:DNA-binding NtrC family response regulator
MQQGTSNSAICAFFSWGALALLMTALHWNRPAAPVVGRISPASASPDPANTAQRDEIAPLWELEKQAIVRALETLNGDKLLAATKLGIGKTTLYRKLKKYGITVEGTFRALESQSGE